MGCTYHTNLEHAHLSFTEEMIMNTNYLPGYMQDWRRYRLEYGFECSCPEGLLYLPPNVDIDKVEKYLKKLCKTR